CAKRDKAAHATTATSHLSPLPAGSPCDRGRLATIVFLATLSHAWPDRLRSTRGTDRSARRLQDAGRVFRDLWWRGEFGGRVGCLAPAGPRRPDGRCAGAGRLRQDTPAEAHRRAELVPPCRLLTMSCAG